MSRTYIRALRLVTGCYGPLMTGSGAFCLQRQSAFSGEELDSERDHDLSFGSSQINFTDYVDVGVFEDYLDQGYSSAALSKFLLRELAAQFPEYVLAKLLAVVYVTSKHTGHTSATVTTTTDASTPMFCCRLFRSNRTFMGHRLADMMLSCSYDGFTCNARYLLQQPRHHASGILNVVSPCDKNIKNP